MSKRAEEAAYNYAKENGTLGYDYNQIYDAAKHGYEQAEKDTIERAIQWLIAHVDDYIVDMEVNIYKSSKLHVGGMCWEDLKKAIEEE